MGINIGDLDAGAEGPGGLAQGPAGRSLETSDTWCRGAGGTRSDAQKRCALHSGVCVRRRVEEVPRSGESCGIERVCVNSAPRLDMQRGREAKKLEAALAHWPIINQVMPT